MGNDGIPPGGVPDGTKMRVSASQLIAMGQGQGQAVGLEEGLGFMLSGETEFDVPKKYRLILADAFLTAINGALMDELKCEHCEKQRPQHPLTEDGWRYCSADDEGEDERKTFRPKKPKEKEKEKSNLVGLDGQPMDDKSSRLIIPG